MSSFDDFWGDVVKGSSGSHTQNGTKILTKTGKPFYYWLDVNGVRTNRTNQRLPKSGFKNSYEVWTPLTEPSELPENVKGPSYVWAILKRFYK